MYSLDIIDYGTRTELLKIYREISPSLKVKLIRGAQAIQIIYLITITSDDTYMWNP